MNNMILISFLFVLPIIAMTVQLISIKNQKWTLLKTNQSIFCFLLLILSFLLFFNKSGKTIVYVANWPAPYGICLVFDRLTTLMLLIFSLVIICINLFSFNDNDQKQNTTFYVGFWLLILGLIGALSTYDIFNLYVWSEVMLVSTFILLGSTSFNNTSNIYHYAIFNIIGTLFMLLGIALLYGITGNLNYAAIAVYFQTHQAHASIPIITLFLLGLAIKGGVFPFYFWLPNAYPRTNVSSTMLLSSLVTKVIMVVLLRLVWLWHPLQSSFIDSLFIFLACCTMFFGVMGAANDFRIRDILSFHIISQLGYILLAIFIPTSLAIIAALYFLIHNIFVKTNLLMTSGIIERQYKTHQLDELGQVLKACPVLAVIFFISAMSLAGVPPLSGFWGKLLIFKATFDDHIYAGLFFAMLVGLLTLYSMIKIWRFGFCQTTKIAMTPYKFKLTSIEISASLPLLIIPLAFGLYPNLILPTLNSIATNLNQPNMMIHAVLGGLQ